MNPEEFNFARRAMGFVSAILATTVLTFTAPAQALIVAMSDFATNAEGWEGLICPNPGVCALGSVPLAVEYLPMGGDPDGYIRTRDPSSDSASRMKPPAKFSDNYALGQTLSFDVRIESNGGGGVFDPGALAIGAPLVTIEESGGATLVFLIPSADFPTIDGAWKHYDVPFAEVPGWVLFSGGALSPLDPGEFATVFGDMSRLTIIGEWLNDADDVDTGGLDNVTLSAIPIPAALPLLISALIGVGASAKRRNR